MSVSIYLSVCLCVCLSRYTGVRLHDLKKRLKETKTLSVGPFDKKDLADKYSLDRSPHGGNYCMCSYNCFLISPDFSPCSHLVYTGNSKLFLVLRFSLPPTMTLFSRFLSVSVIIVSSSFLMMSRSIILCPWASLCPTTSCFQKWWPFS